jgi:hypothetical protein
VRGEQPHDLAANGMTAIEIWMRAAVMKRIGNFVRLTSLRHKLIKIDIKLVSHGRNTTFQLAEVEVRSTSPGCGPLSQSMTEIVVRCDRR